MFKIYYLLFALKTVTCSCTNEQKNDFAKTDYEITKIGEMPPQVNESSGLVATQQNTYWTHNDSGGEPKLYEINQNGELLDSMLVPNAKNVDWEDLTKDNKGNFFVGDFGNNSQKRQDLTIYKTDGNTTERINFRYADQTDYPAQKPEYDCEAFFWHNDSLYLFTKSYAKKKHITRLYVLSDKAGSYVLSPKAAWAINSAVTAADISPDGSEFALLTYGKILIFNVINKGINFNHPKACFKTRRKQTEAICYSPTNYLIFGNEQGGLFRLNLTLR